MNKYKVMGLAALCSVMGYGVSNYAMHQGQMGSRLIVKRSSDGRVFEETVWIGDTVRKILNRLRDHGIIQGNAKLYIVGGTYGLASENPLRDDLVIDNNVLKEFNNSQSILIREEEL